MTQELINTYGHRTKGGEINTKLNQAEACVVLKIHDRGMTSLTAQDLDAFYSLMQKLRKEIRP